MEINVTSLVASRTGKGVVQVQVDGQNPVQMDVQEARKVAIDILGAAEAAQTDAIVLEMLSDAPDEARFGTLLRMRELRSKQDDAAL